MLSINRKFEFLSLSGTFSGQDEIYSTLSTIGAETALASNQRHLIFLQLASPHPKMTSFYKGEKPFVISARFWSVFVTWIEVMLS